MLTWQEGQTCRVPHKMAHENILPFVDFHTICCSCLILESWRRDACLLFSDWFVRYRSWHTYWQLPASIKTRSLCFKAADYKAADGGDIVQDRDNEDGDDDCHHQKSTGLFIFCWRESTGDGPLTGWTCNLDGRWGCMLIRWSWGAQSELNWAIETF